MKTRFTTLDIIAAVSELSTLLQGCRLVNVYDIDSKSYLLKFTKPEKKFTLLIESGIRFHYTSFEWPKNPCPSGFSMKLRKHLKQKRLTHVKQVGFDRIVDFQFGTEEFAFHLILELYDRGNVILTDHELTILNVIRPRSDESKDVKFVVGESYPLHNAQTHSGPLTLDRLEELLSKAKPSDPLKRVLVPQTIYGPALIDHAMRSAGVLGDAKVSSVDTAKVSEIVNIAEVVLQNICNSTTYKGYITLKKEKSLALGDSETGSEIISYVDFHPWHFVQLDENNLKTFDSFNEAVDNFFSSIDSIKIEQKALQQEKAALKKLENFKTDHDNRLKALSGAQEFNRRKGQLIEINLELVDKALTVIRSAVANQIAWKDIEDIIANAQAEGDPVATCIKHLNLKSNEFTMVLENPFGDDSSSDSEADTLGKERKQGGQVEISIALNKSAYANARSYYDSMRQASTKEKKTLDASLKAYKNAERTTKQNLKQVQTLTKIQKMRKTYWFEKFYWFVSSDNYLVVGGRDQQQNEYLVKRHLRRGDVYVHADLHGASSVLIKNHRASEDVIPPRTLQEAGVFAMAFSMAWEAKLVTSAYWVNADQVSKTAPTGEYLTTGAFMVRGKKNFLPPSPIIMGFGLMFKLEEGSIERHLEDRMPRVSCNSSDPTGIAELTSTSDETSELVDLEDQEEGSVKEGEVVVSDSEEEGDSKSEESQSGDERRLEDRFSEENEEFDSNSGDVETSNTSYVMDDDSQVKSEAEVTIQSKISPKYITEERVNSSRSSRENDNSNPDPIKCRAGAISKNSNSKKLQKSSQHKLPEELPQSETFSKDKGVGEISQKISQSHIPPTRGQMRKARKQLDKYKDQDEEEKQLRLQLLKPDGEVKPKKVKGKRKQQQGGRKQGADQTRFDQHQRVNSASGEFQKQPVIDIDREDDDEDALGGGNFNQNELNQLTGQPVEEDELLFALPVCAPYSTMLSYKYKVKLIPGTERRGKAAKKALYCFTLAKDSPPHHKDLLRSIKDTDLSRNIPGKVKMSFTGPTRIGKLKTKNATTS